MKRMKVFILYLIIFIAAYVAFDYFAYNYLVNSYKNIKTYEVVGDAPSVTLMEAKATAVNGYVTARIKNNTGKDISKTTVKIDLFNARGNNLGTKYCKLENFKKNDTKEIKVSFRANNISNIKISFTDDDVDEEIKKQADELKQTANKWIPIVGLVALISMA